MSKALVIAMKRVFLKIENRRSVYRLACENPVKIICVRRLSSIEIIF